MQTQVAHEILTCLISALKKSSNWLTILNTLDTVG